jgi:hypothetical protein
LSLALREAEGSDLAEDGGTEEVVAVIGEEIRVVG